MRVMPDDDGVDLEQHVCWRAGHEKVRKSAQARENGEQLDPGNL
jgi:hypothetical protein